LHRSEGVVYGKPVFNIRPAMEMPNDPSLMTAPQIKAYMRGSGFSDVVGRVHRIFRAGPKGSALAWAAPMSQDGYECQALAVVNGVRFHQAAMGSGVWEPTAEQVDALRMRAAKANPLDDPSESPTEIMEVLSRAGHLKRLSLQLHPLKVARDLTTAGAFAVDVDADGWHARTIVPNLHGFQLPDGVVPELLVLDSMHGRVSAMTAEQLCARLRDIDTLVGDSFEMCRYDPGNTEGAR
jgi:hypothetical protein